MVDIGWPSGRVPWKVTMFIIPQSACTCSGAASARVRKTRGTTMCPVTWRPPVGKGGCAFRIESSGALTRIGATAPSLFGICGTVRHFTA